MNNVTAKTERKSTTFACIGSLISMALSWTTNHSWLWLIFHGICGWLYNLYWAFEYAGLANFIQGMMV